MEEVLNSVYSTIKRDSKHNYLVKIIYDAINLYASKNNKEFKPGEITATVLYNRCLVGLLILYNLQIT